VNFFEFILNIKITSISKHNSNAKNFQNLHQGPREAYTAVSSGEKGRLKLASDCLFRS
jgi:hypothetical protein